MYRPECVCYNGKVYQLALMKENVHRGTHALTGLMFAALVIMLS